MKRNKSERGQAIIELALAMVAIMVVFLGIIFAYALGKLNVEGIVECRGTADDYAGNGTPGNSGQPILTWREGKDGRIFTNDDEAQAGGETDGQTYVDELKSDSIDLVTGFNHPYVHHNFATETLGSNSLFLNMANLTSFRTVSDPYDIDELSDLQGAFSSLIYNSDLTVENSAFMPMFYNED